MIICPTSLIHPSAIIGEGAVIKSFCSVLKDVVIGKNVLMEHYVHLTVGTKVGDQVFLGPRLTTLNARKIVHGRDYDYPPFEPPTIEDGCRIGTGVIIYPGVTIAQECVIGVGSVVMKDTIPFGIYWGTPAKLMKVVPEEERIKW